MNILVSTTFNWNPGDEFIRMGALRVFESRYGREHSYFFWNRNPDYKSVEAPLSNSFNRHNLDLSSIDLVLIAGSPDWFGDSYTGLYQAVLDKGIPLLALGIGSPFENISLTPLELAVLNRPNSTVIARDENVLNHVKGICLPCPALFCSDVVESSKSELLIAQGTKTVNQSISDNLYSQLQNTQSDVCVFYKADFLQWPQAYYSPDPAHLLRHISQYEWVTSTRLHGAIAALSLGKCVTLLADKDNFRITAAQKLFQPILQSPATVIEQFKQETLQKYLSAL